MFLLNVLPPTGSFLFCDSVNLKSNIPKGSLLIYSSSLLMFAISLGRVLILLTIAAGPAFLFCFDEAVGMPIRD